MNAGTIALRDGTPWQHTEFMRCMIDLARKLPSDVGIIHAPMNDADEARNVFAETFEGDWLLQLDTDQAFHWNLVERVLESAEALDAEVLTGLYYRRLRPYWPMIYYYESVAMGDEDHGRIRRKQYREVPQQEPFTVGACGAGCLFTRRSALEKVAAACPESRPFDFIYEPGERRLGEDFSFSLRCLYAGVDIWCDPRIRVNHLTWFSVLPMMDREVAEAGGVDLSAEPAWPVELEVPV